MKSNSSRYFRAILIAGLIIGTLDIFAAILHTLILGGNPIRLLQYIGSALFGSRAFESAIPYAPLGLLFHYLWAFFWAWLYFFMAPIIEKRRIGWIPSGIGYGVLVWVLMNLVVLPISLVPSRPLTVSAVLIGIATLILAIGLPLAFMAHKYFKRAGQAPTARGGSAGS